VGRLRVGSRQVRLHDAAFARADEISGGDQPGQHVGAGSGVESPQPLRLLVFCCGNALTILFEGLTATVQPLRLEYYELFREFFTPSGR
jgi:hypothetical protein